MEKKSGINEKNRKLLDSLNRFGKNLFSIKEASKMMGLPIKENEEQILQLGECNRRIT